MNIENLIRLTGGSKHSKPSVSSITDYAFDPYKVKPGDAYMALDRSQASIDIAVARGAYAIFFDRPVLIGDPEIAWIEVENVEMAMVRLMRFESSYRKLQYVAITLLQETILENLRLPFNVHILSQNLTEVFQCIMHASEGSFLFCSNTTLLQKIAPIHESIWTEHQAVAMEGSTLFQSSFVHQGIYYRNLPLAPLFIPAFSGVLTFLQEKALMYRVEPFKPLSHFEPLFVDRAMGVHPFGSTRQALIIESSEELFEYEAKILKRTLPNKSLLIGRPKKSTLQNDVDFIYDTEADLKKLDASQFRYALILGDKQKIETALNAERPYQQLSLF